MATVNHTGAFGKGHYAAFVKLPNSSSWKSFNDTAVLRSSVEKINNTSSYIYIYKVFKITTILSCLVRWLGYLSLSLGVKTLHITPVI